MTGRFFAIISHCVYSMQNRQDDSLRVPSTNK